MYRCKTWLKSGRRAKNCTYGFNAGWLPGEGEAFPPHVVGAQIVFAECFVFSGGFQATVVDQLTILDAILSSQENGSCLPWVFLHFFFPGLGVWSGFWSPSAFWGWGWGPVPSQKGVVTWKAQESCLCPL